MHFSNEFTSMVESSKVSLEQNLSHTSESPTLNATGRKYTVWSAYHSAGDCQMKFHLEENDPLLFGTHSMPDAILPYSR